MILDKKKYSKELKVLDEYIDTLPTKEGKLIVVLHKAQNLFGYLPEELQNHIAQKLNIPLAKVYGVVTFYSYFNMEKKGVHKIAVCMGTACYVRGSEKILDEFKDDLGIDVGETSDDGFFSLDGVRCIGACGLAPVVTVNGKVYGRVEKKDVKNIIEECMAKGGERVE